MPMHPFTSDYWGLHFEDLLSKNTCVIRVYPCRPACSTVPLEHVKLHSLDQDSEEARWVLVVMCRLQLLCSYDFIHASVLQIRCLVSS